MQSVLYCHTERQLLGLQVSKPEVFHAVCRHAAAAIQSVTAHAALQPTGSPAPMPIRASADKTCLGGNAAHHAAVGMLDASGGEPAGGGASEHQAPTKDAATALQDMQHTPQHTLASRQPAQIPMLATGTQAAAATEQYSVPHRMGSIGPAQDTLEVPAARLVAHDGVDMAVGVLGRVVPGNRTVLPKLPSAEELQLSDCKSFNIGASFLFQIDSVCTLSVVKAHACT